MAEYKHGSADMTEHEKAFHGLLKGAVLVAVIAVISLIFLAIVGTNPT